MVQAKLPRLHELGGRARGAIHRCTRELRELQRRRSHTAADGVHEDALAGADVELPEERIIGGEEHLGDCCPLLPRQIARHGEHLALVHAQILRVRAAAGDAHDSGAHGPKRRAGAEGVHSAGVLEAGDVGWRTRWGRVRAGALHEVRPIERGSVHAHADLTEPGLGDGAVLLLEDVGLSGHRNDDGAHA